MHKTGGYLLLVCEFAVEKSAKIPIGAIVLRLVAGSLVALTRLLELCHMLFFDFGLFLFNIRTIFSLRACSPHDARRRQSHHDRPSAVYVTCVGRMLFVTKRLRFDLTDSSNHPKAVQRLLYALYALQPVTSRRLAIPAPMHASFIHSTYLQIVHESMNTF